MKRDSQKGRDLTQKVDAGTISVNFFVLTRKHIDGQEHPQILVYLVVLMNALQPTRQILS